MISQYEVQIHKVVNNFSTVNLDIDKHKHR